MSKILRPAFALASSTALTMPRAVRSLRAEVNVSATELKAVVDKITKAFEDMKTENDAAIKKADVVQTEKVDRINTAISESNKQLDELVKKFAAAQLGGGAKPIDPAKAAYAEGFDKYFRKGVDAELNDLAIKASMKSDSDPDGGYTVPREMEKTIDRVLSTVSSMRGLATVRSVSSSSYQKLVNQGGTTGGWVGERETRSETNTSTLSALDYPVMELYANPFATQRLLDDSAVDIENWIADEVSIVFAEKEGLAFITGDGVNKPRGILGYTPTANTSYVWGNPGYIASGVAANINDGSNNGTDKLFDVVYAIKQGYRNNASWIMNRTLAGAVRKLKGLTSGDYLWAPPQFNGVAGPQPATLCGYPIADDDNMPDVAANAYPIAFGDFKRAYLIVDRVGIRVLRDPFTNKPYIGFYTTKRVGGGVQNFEAYKLLKCATS